jgi:hypothetical protein
MCKHETEYLMGVAGGVICRKCGQRFDHIPKQETEAKPKAEKAPEVKAEAPVEEKPKKTTRKAAAKKGAK